MILMGCRGSWLFLEIDRDWHSELPQSFEGCSGLIEARSVWSSGWSSDVNDWRYMAYE